MKDISYNLPYLIIVISTLIIFSPFIQLAFAQSEEIDLGVGEEIDKQFDSLNEYFTDLIYDADVDSNQIPTNTTEQELIDLLNSATDTGKSGKTFLFTFHKLIENVIKAVSPIDIDPLIILLISFSVAMITVYIITKGSMKHLILFGGIFGTVIILFMIGGINPEF